WCPQKRVVPATNLAAAPTKAEKGHEPSLAKIVSGSEVSGMWSPSSPGSGSLYHPGDSPEISAAQLSTKSDVKNPNSETTNPHEGKLDDLKRMTFYDLLSLPRGGREDVEKEVQRRFDEAAECHE